MEVVQMIRYSVDIHFSGKGWDTYTVNGTTIANARYLAVCRVRDELSEAIADTIDGIRVYSELTGELLKEYPF